MNEFLPVLGILAGLVSFAAYPFYIRDMLYGTTRPERASWLIWLVLNVIGLTAQLAEGGTWSVVMTGAHTVGLSVVLALSVKFGYGGLMRRDVVSLIVAAFGLIAWGLTNDPLIALLFVVAIRVVGVWLTIYKTYHKPGSETLISWYLDCLGGLLAILAVGTFSPTLLIIPVYTALDAAAVVATIYIARAKHAQLETNLKTA